MLPGQLPPGHRVEFLVERRQDLVERSAIPVPRRIQQ
jgi:hypothetical protein